jgi:hypothetical protein
MEVEEGSCGGTNAPCVKWRERVERRVIGMIAKERAV